MTLNLEQFKLSNWNNPLFTITSNNNLSQKRTVISTRWMNIILDPIAQSYRKSPLYMLILFENLFDGMLGTWNSKLVDFEWRWGPAKDVHLFYAIYHLSAPQICKSIFSTIFNKFHIKIVVDTVQSLSRFVEKIVKTYLVVV